MYSLRFRGHVEPLLEGGVTVVWMGEDGLAFEDSVPGWDCRVDEFLNQSVYLRVPFRVEIVDVASELDSAILSEGQVSWEPLVCFRPVFPVHELANILARSPRLLDLDLLVLWDNLALAGPFVDSVGNPNYFFLNELGLAWLLGISRL